MIAHLIHFFAIQGRIFRVLVASCVLFTLCFDEYRQSLYNAADCRIWRHSLIDAKFIIFSINEKKILELSETRWNFSKIPRLLFQEFIKLEGHAEKSRFVVIT